MRTVLFIALITCSVAFFSDKLFNGFVAYADCPNCFRDQKRMTGRASEGRPDTIDGRPAVSVRITGDWDDSPGHTTPVIYNAVTNAISRWNNANLSGQRAPYTFDLRQTDSGAQIKVVKDPSITTCARVTGPSGGPYTIHLPPNADQRLLEALIETIEHELGHTAGLWHPSGPSACATIMGYNSKRDCNGTDKQITADDIQKSNLGTATPSGGTENTPCSWYHPSQAAQSPDVGGGGGGGYVEPTPPSYAPPVCHYSYYSRDFYSCSRVDDGPVSCSFQGTRYYLYLVSCD